MKQGLDSLFEGTGSRLAVSVDQIRLSSDRVIVRDAEPEEKRIGSVIIPETAENMLGIGKGGKLRTGVVVAVGPGDAFFELPPPAGVGYAWGDSVRRRELPSVVPPQVQPEDKVIYEVRKHERFFLNDIPYYVMHAEQAIIAVYLAGFHCWVPLYDRIFVKQLASEERIGSIIIPGKSQDRSYEGVVVQVGPGKIGADGKLVAIDVRNGDRVLFSKTSGDDIEIGENMLVMRDRDILAVVG